MTVTYFLAWLIPSIIAGGLLMLSAYWGMKYPKTSDDRKITLWDIIAGAAAALCPGVNVLVSIGMFVWFCGEVAPKIVLFGRRE